jgi:hypothetical protein
MDNIHSAITSRFNTHRYVLFNSYVFSWESDYFSITQDEKYIYEVEVKLSRSDFKADFQKDAKHRLLANATKQDLVVQRGHLFSDYEVKNGVPGQKVEMCGVDYIKAKECTPNRFYYCCPDGLLSVEEIPAYAGLLYLNEANTSVREVKKAPFIHKEKNVDKYIRSLIDKFYFQFVNMRNKYLYAKQIQKRIDKIEAENYRLIEAVDVMKNGSLLDEIERLKKEIKKMDSAHFKTKMDNNKLARDVHSLEIKIERHYVLKEIKV